MNFQVKNQTPKPKAKARIILKTADTLISIFGGVVMKHVLSDAAEEIYKAIRKDIKLSPDLINYHEVVKIIQDMKFYEISGPEMADHNDLLDKVHKRLKSLKAVSKKEE